MGKGISREFVFAPGQSPGILHPNVFPRTSRGSEPKARLPRLEDWRAAEQERVYFEGGGRVDEDYAFDRTLG